jgi:hypothetical protein
MRVWRKRKLICDAQFVAQLAQVAVAGQDSVVKAVDDHTVIESNASG